MNNVLVPVDKVYTPAHTFFGDLVTMLFQIYANMSAFSNFVALNNMPDTTKRYLASYGWRDRPFFYHPSHYDQVLARLHYIAAGTISPNEAFTLSSIYQPYYAYYYPYRISEPICTNGWPNKVEVFFGRKPVGDIAPDSGAKQMLSSPEHTYPMKAAIRASLISYYENTVDAIKQKYTDQVANWPSIWNFARVIRNACGHGGKIKFDKPSSKPVRWRNHTYGPQDNGKEVLYGKEGLSTVEVILLFEDMHNAI